MNTSKFSILLSSILVVMYSCTNKPKQTIPLVSEEEQIETHSKKLNDWFETNLLWQMG